MAKLIHFKQGAFERVVNLDYVYDSETWIHTPYEFDEDTGQPNKDRSPVRYLKLYFAVPAGGMVDGEAEITAEAMQLKGRTADIVWQYLCGQAVDLTPSIEALEQINANHP